MTQKSPYPCGCGDSLIDLDSCLFPEVQQCDLRKLKKIPTVFVNCEEIHYLSSLAYDIITDDITFPESSIKPGTLQ